MNYTKSAVVLPGAPGFIRMTAAQYNAHLLANPGCGRRGGHSAAHGGYGVDTGPELRSVALVLGSPGSRAARASPEEDLHRLVFEWIFAMQSVHPILKFMMHVPNGGVRSRGEAGKLKAMGVRKGVSDVVCPFANDFFKGFACELKAPKGRCTPEQSVFLSKAKSDGWLTAVCFCLDDFIALAQTFLGIRAEAQVPPILPAPINVRG